MKKMKVKVNISKIRTVNELESYWTNQDFIELLDRMNMPDADKLNPTELKDLLYMAITDFEPAEAAEIILTYKLGERLTPGQIQNLSHEFLEEKVAEQYADPSFHYDLFNINQLLFKAFNGTFPNTEASIILLEITDHDGNKIDANKEILTKAIAESLSDRSLIKRLFEDQLNGVEDFGDAEKIIWTFQPKEGNVYEVITSKYWIEKDDLEQNEYEVAIKFYEGEDD
jgi:hypothetical protein